MTDTPKKFLLTAGRAPSTLDLARQLNVAGHKVFIADTIVWHVCYFSNAVEKSFVIPSPRFQTEACITKLVEIINREKIDVLIPTFEEILYISRYLDRFPAFCKVFSSSFELLINLHNKWNFFELQNRYGIKAPEAFLIETKEDLKKLNPTTSYALKASYSRSAQSVLKTEPGKPIPEIEIEPHNPWIAQKWLEGNRYCTYSVCQEGRVTAHATYPVQIAIQGHFCLNYEAVSHKGILEWVEKFAALTGFTGQVGFDFFETAEGTIYAIECNPRGTHGLILFKPEDRLDLAFLNPFLTPPIIPKEGNRKQVAAGMMCYGWKSAYKESKLLEFFKIYFTSPDVVFDRKDLKPFLSTPFVYSNYFYLSLRSRLNLPASFTHDFNWDGEDEIAHSTSSSPKEHYA